MSPDPRDNLFVTPPAATDRADCFFYHTMDLPGHGVIDGHWDLRDRFGDYTNFHDFAGKRVLDIGAGSGFLTFAAEEAGAREVVSFDMDHSLRQDFLPFVESEAYLDRAAYAEKHNDWIRQWHNAYWLSHDCLGSNARVYHGDVYDLPEAIGQFDTAIVGSILEHLADPVKALTSIARRTDETMLIVTPMLETDEPIARFMGHKDNPDNSFTFWIYSRGTYANVLGILGFEIVQVAKREFAFALGNRLETRHVITARRVG